MPVSATPARTNLWHVVIGLPILVLCGYFAYQCAHVDPAEQARQNVESRARRTHNSEDGSVDCVKVYLRHNLKDPDSYRPIEWSQVSTLSDGSLAVRHRYRAKNSFGGYGMEDRVFIYDSSGTVLSSKEVN